MDARPYDALLLVSFGGPEKPEDVVPFLENVTRGRGIPKERLVEVGEHYFGFGGKSPINGINRELLAALRADFAEQGVELPIYWGNRNWDPYLADAFEQMVADGVERVACFMTSAYSSYSSCRQYREDLFEVSHDLPIRVDRLRHHFNHPVFVELFTEYARDALAQVGPDAHVVFVTHSVPEQMNEASGGPGCGLYERQHLSVARMVSEALGVTEWSLAYCSRSGPPSQPWLEPDINDHLEELAGKGVTSVVLVPIGFVADHMEVVYDLDTEAKATAEELGLRFARAASPNADPRYAAMIRDLLLERAAAERGESPERPAVGEFGPKADTCAADCCLNPRSQRPVLA
ncbi:ferrochelatase [Aeromicrobium duanguangcaii]|uniref:Coproporphyrin III ferrochelatase n=1 Tax=Aeromicrobium duanguangcaii TaxID=2968086 RepID=A0ABY5KED6_9ACTN|nr:ferrochelatase [Aeromicrobium duanguangcaii]MCL3837324.1 ferrochelatase [Aeromicrobium duanguangcaii]UUI67356.1 ferrochelatase [Aeromicrobium duanguangcaii]